MKFTVTKPVEIDISYVAMSLPVMHGEEQIPNDFPLRKGELWKACVNIETGEIQEWPKGRSGDLHLKVVDCGVYELLDSQEHFVAGIYQDYVPHGVVPGEYGDYVELKIQEDGTIANWPKKPNVDAFFPNETD